MASDPIAHIVVGICDGTGGRESDGVSQKSPEIGSIWRIGSLIGFKEIDFSMLSIAPNVMSEAFEDETVVVNMDRGHYYALNGASAQIWAQILAEEKDAETLLDATTLDAQTFDVFLRLLSQEGLISGHPAFTTAQDPEVCLAGTNLFKTFERFTDVEGLLLLDPIHDFEGANWPAADRREI